MARAALEIRISLSRRGQRAGPLPCPRGTERSGAALRPPGGEGLGAAARRRRGSLWRDKSGGAGAGLGPTELPGTGSGQSRHRCSAGMPQLALPAPPALPRAGPSFPGWLSPRACRGSVVPQQQVVGRAGAWLTCPGDVVANPSAWRRGSR